MSDKLKHLSSILDNPLIGRATTAVVLVTVIWVVIRMLRRVVTARIADTTARYRARKVIGVAGWLLVVIAGGAVFSDRLGGLALSLSVVGAGVAFALQEVIASIAGRVAIMFNRFYEVGERVQLGGIKGDVIDIGLLRTTLMEVGDWVKGDLFTGRIVRVANSFVFKEPVFNYSGDFSFLWDEITIPIKYGCDHRTTRQMLERVVHDVCDQYVPEAAESWNSMLRLYRVEPAQVEPMVTLIANDNWMEFTVRYVVPHTRRRKTKDELFTRILDEVDASGGKIALASATFHLVEAPRLDVRVQQVGDARAPGPPASS